VDFKVSFFAFSYYIILVTAVMGYYAASRAELRVCGHILIDNPKYQDYMAFRQKFAIDGNFVGYYRCANRLK